MYRHIKSSWQQTLAAVLTAFIIMSSSGITDEINLQLRFQSESDLDSGRFSTKSRTEMWDFSKTAIIVCDVWDSHHCLNAVRRVEEFAPRLNKVLSVARRLGATIIHSPSDCMPAYEQHPARIRAQSTPVAARQPYEIAQWCSKVAAEERGIWPIDQSDGGEDDDPQEHAEWVKELKASGRSAATPWLRQSDRSNGA